MKYLTQGILCFHALSLNPHFSFWVFWPVWEFCFGALKVRYPHFQGKLFYLQELSDYKEGKVPATLIEKFVATIIVDSPTHFSWFLMLDEGEYHQSFCTLEGRKNTLRLDVRTVEDDGVLPTFFHNQYFTEIDSIAKNTYQSGVLHRPTSKTPANK